jgi:hypothetical protein
MLNECFDKNNNKNLVILKFPAGCEELQFPSELQSMIASSLKTYSNSALIGDTRSLS